MQAHNRKAKFNYRFYEKYEAGLVLSGAEVKAIKKGLIDISAAYVKIIEREAFLINANIPVEGKKDYNSTQTRKLLLHKGQITTIQSKVKAKKLTIVPTRVYSKGRLIKAEIALAKAKKQYEKKDLLKRRDIERDIERELREEKSRYTDLKRV